MPTTFSSFSGSRFSTSEKGEQDLDTMDLFIALCDNNYQQTWRVFVVICIMIKHAGSSGHKA
jgi:hypothetical protein